MKLYWANMIIDRHGSVAAPYHQSHYDGFLTIEEARALVQKWVDQGGVIFSYIQEHDCDTDTNTIVEYKSYLSVLGSERRIEAVEEWTWPQGIKNIEVYEINDDVSARTFYGAELYSGPKEDCPAAVLDRRVMKVIDRYSEDDDVEKGTRRFIVYKEDPRPWRS